MRKVSYALVLALCACGNARIIQMTPAGGIIELQGDRSKAMEQATSDMNAKCGPNNFTIVQEGEEPVGTQTVVQQEPVHTSPSGGTTTETTASTNPVMAWRIHFQCNGAIGGPPPLPLPPPPIDQPPPPPDPSAPAPGY